MQRFGDFAPLERNRVNDAIFNNLYFGPFRKCVDALDANAVQAARHLVGVAIELTASVQFGHDDFNRWATIDRRVVALHRVDRHAATVITHRAGSIDADSHCDDACVADHDLVDRVVDGLIDKMVQRAETSPAHVHAGTFADGFKPFEDLNRLRGVLGRGLGRTLLLIADFCHW